MEFTLYVFLFGYLFQHIGTFTQIKRMEKKQSAEGICVDTQILFLIGAISRGVWITDTMLKSMVLTYIELVLAIISLSYTLFACLYRFNFTESIMSIINNRKLPIFLRWYILFIASSVLSYFYFPGNEGQNYDIQMLVSLTMYCEASGLLPQIFYVNIEKDSNIFSSMYLIFITISRVLRLYFWVSMYQDDNSFLFLMIADIVHLVMVSGFIWSFFKNLDVMSLPTREKPQFVNYERRSD